MVKKTSNSKSTMSASAVPVQTSSMISPIKPAEVQSPNTSSETIHTASPHIPDYLQPTFRSVPNSFMKVNNQHLTFQGAHYSADLGLKSYLLILHQIASQKPNEKQLFICPDDLSAYHFQDELNTISKPHADNSEVITANQASDTKKPIKFLDYKSLGLESGSDINQVVDNFIKKNNLSGTSKLYFYQGEHLSTELGSRFFKSLVSKLKTQEPNLQVFAISNYDITHETSNHEPLSSKALYGHENNFPSIQSIRSQKNIPAIEVEGIRSFGALEDRKAVIAAGKGDEFNIFLLEKVQQELNLGSKKILIKTSSRDQIDTLAKLAKSKNLNIGFYNSRKTPPSNSVNNCKEKTYDNPYELIKAWGTDFDVLVHCQKFDGMEIPADCLFIADTTDSDYELAKIIAPVFTLDESKKPKKIYYLHGEHNDFQVRLKRIQNHNRHKISCGMSSPCSNEGSPILASADIVENGESKHLPALGLFWDIFKKSNLFNIDFKGLASNYLKSNSLSSEVFEPGRLAENIQLGYNKNFFTKDINLEDIYRYAFTYFGKSNDLSNAISTYPSLLGIRNLQEASDRVFSIYKSIYRELQSSSVLNEFNHTANQNGEPVWRLNSSFIAEFLFTQAPQYLTQQDFYALDKKYDQVLAEVISVLMGVKKDFDQDSPLKTLKLNFQKFLIQKRLAREAETKKNLLNMTKKECLDLVEVFLLEDSSNQDSQDIDVSKIPILTDAFYGLQKISDDEDLNARFYTYVIDKKPESKNPILLASILPPETDDDKKFLINSFMPDFPDDLVKLFSSKKRNLANEFQKFLLNKSSDKLGSKESIETFMKEFNDLNSPKTREFLKFVFGEISPEIYEALKFKLEFENQDEKIEFLKYKLNKSIKITNKVIDVERLDLTNILKEAKIDLDEVFHNLGILENLTRPLASSEKLSEELSKVLNLPNNTQICVLPEKFKLLLAPSLQPYHNYLKQELVLAELLKQISPNQETKFSRIIVCDNDDNPEDTRVLIVNFGESFVPNVYFFDPGVKKPAEISELKNINLDNLGVDNNQDKLFGFFNYYLQVYPYLQFNDAEQSEIKTQLKSLFEEFQKNTTGEFSDHWFYSPITNFYLFLKSKIPKLNPLDFIDHFLSSLLQDKFKLISDFKSLFPILAKPFNKSNDEEPKVLK
jgi:hypothetical protein